jgi:hypothetical protein
LSDTVCSDRKTGDSLFSELPAKYGASNIEDKSKYNTENKRKSYINRKDDVKWTKMKDKA